jgi:ribosomal protein S24E
MQLKYNSKMDFNINNRNELFNRQELEFDTESSKNPSFEDMRKKISEELGKSEDVVDVYGIKGGFGSNVFRVRAHIYDDRDSLEKAIALRKTKKQKKEEIKAAEEEKKAEEAKKSEEEKKAEEGTEIPDSKESEDSISNEKSESEEKPAEEEKKE